MTSDEKGKTGSGPTSASGPEVRVEGRAALADAQAYPGDLQLRAYVFDRAGGTLGAADLDPQGNFSVPLAGAKPGDVQVVIGPADDPQVIRKSAAFSQSFSAKDWTVDARSARLRADLVLPRDIVSLWWPTWVCVTGHVRKTFQRDGVQQTCPVPFVKVEIFDVDREDCWWPYLDRWSDLVADKLVVRVPDLLRERRPFPFPGPGPAPGPRAAALRLDSQALTAPVTADAASLARLDKLTLVSRTAPWLIFTRCFYSRQLVCETTTDDCGYFRCCFSWSPFHFRRGRFRFDPRPDVIVKVTQVIDGVETVIYLDPYSSTRWNVSGTHLDLYLDNEAVQCGSCDGQTRPEGTSVFFTRIGDDEVYKIDQASGTYSSPGFPPTTNMAYGDWLRVYAQFGDTLSRAQAIPGATSPYFYRLSHSRNGVDFTLIKTELSDTRVNKASLFSESHSLGPQTIGGVPGLYAVRDFANYYWYNPDWIGYWDTVATESDTATFVVRLEVFDANGTKLGSTKVDYRDGTVAPPAVLPPMADRCDMRIAVDNKAPNVVLTIPAVVNDCGVVPWAAAGSLSFHVAVSQENGRLHSWQLEYTKGVLPGSIVLAGGSSNSGAPSPVTQDVSGAPLVAGLTTTCAFALKLGAWSHVRNGYGLVYYEEMLQAIAIEKCS